MKQKILALLRSPAAVYLGASVLARVGSILLIPLYTRRLSLEEYGDYALFLTIVALLSTFLSGGLSAAVPKYYFSEQDRAAGKARAGEVALWLLSITVVLTAACGLGVWFLAVERGTGLLGRWSLWMAIAAAAGMALSAVPSTLLRAEQRPYAAAGFQMAQFITMTGAGLALVAGLDRGYRGTIEAAAASYVITGVLSAIYVLLLPRGAMRLRDLGKALAFSAPFIPHFVAQWGQGAADRWVLHSAGRDDELGGYSLASQVSSPVHMVVYAWNDSVGPRLGEVLREGGIPALAAQRSRVLRGYLIAIGGPGVLLCAALPLAALLVGEDFRAALVMVPFLVAALLPDAFYFTDFHIVYYAGGSRALGRATVLAALVNLGANVLLIPFMGAWGAVAARFVAASVRALIVAWAARHLRRPIERPLT